jgi:hypothetical protein
MTVMDKRVQTCRNRKLARRGSPAPTHVEQITSALCEISLSVALFNALYFFSSALDSSPGWSTVKGVSNLVQVVRNHHHLGQSIPCLPFATEFDSG